MEDLHGAIQNAYTTALEDLAKKIEDSGRVIAPGAYIEWEWAEQGTYLTATVDTIPKTLHVCDTGNFDRTLCAEPCGAMHSYCDTCGERQDPCTHEKVTP